MKTIYITIFFCFLHSSLLGNDCGVCKDPLSEQEKIKCLKAQIEEKGVSCVFFDDLIKSSVVNASAISLNNPVLGESVHKKVIECIDSLLAQAVKNKKILEKDKDLKKSEINFIEFGNLEGIEGKEYKNQLEFRKEIIHALCNALKIFEEQKVKKDKSAKVDSVKISIREYDNLKKASFPSFWEKWGMLLLAGVVLLFLVASFIFIQKNRDLKRDKDGLKKEIEASNNTIKQLKDDYRRENKVVIQTVKAEGTASQAVGSLLNKKKGNTDDNREENNTAEIPQAPIIQPKPSYKTIYVGQPQGNVFFHSSDAFSPMETFFSIKIKENSNEGSFTIVDDAETRKMMFSLIDAYKDICKLDGLGIPSPDRVAAEPGKVAKDHSINAWRVIEKMVIKW